MSWKRGTKTRRIVMIMSEGSEARKGDKGDKNASDYVRGFGKLENGF